MKPLQGKTAIVAGATRGARGIACALATDDQVMKKSGRVLRVGGLAGEYGFTDIDGRLIPAFVIPDQK
ncbi:MAG TPA: hypothetical protein VNQ79_17035 [Blastocatellia bacterium]|nr:hypothetical protein [Blastocatellia bacterium]